MLWLTASSVFKVRRLEGCVAEVTKERDALLAEASTEKSSMAKSIEELQVREPTPNQPALHTTLVSSRRHCLL